MKFAYADPPYLGCGGLYVNSHPDARDWDDPETHRRLIQRLCDEYTDGWVMSLHEPSLRELLIMVPEEVRVMSWVKPFAVFRPGVGLAYAWEPLFIFRGRKIERSQPTVRDWIAENITLKKGLTGAKPARFCRWVFSALNAVEEDDTMDDLFPGTGVVGREWNRWREEGCPPEVGGSKK